MDIPELPEIILLRDTVITLGQLLKYAGIVGSGGDVKLFLTETSITINKEHDNRRGRKLYAGDIVAVEGHKPLLLASAAETPETNPQNSPDTMQA